MMTCLNSISRIENKEETWIINHDLVNLLDVLLIVDRISSHFERAHINFVFLIPPQLNLDLHFITFELDVYHLSRFHI